MGDKYLTSEELAAYIKRPIQTIYRWTYMDSIPHLHAGSRLLFERSVIDEWLRQRAAPRKKLAPRSQFEEARARIRSLKTENTAVSA